MAKKKIDFSGIESFQRAPEGTHTVKVVEMEETTFQSGNEGFKVAFEIMKGAGKGARVYENFPLAENSLWKLKSLLEAVRIKADGRIMLDTNKVVGKTLEIDVYHEEYEGRMRARLGEMRRLGAGKVEDDDDEEEEDFEDDIEEEEEIEEAPKKAKKAPAKKAKAQPEPEEDDDDEDETEEEEAPAKKSKKANYKLAKKDPEPEDDEEWDDDEEWED